MLPLIVGFYFLLLFMFVITYFFIAYHLIKYSINSELNRIMVPFFIIISILLLISNIILFYSVDWVNLLDKISL